MTWGALVGTVQRVSSSTMIVSDTFTRADSALTPGSAETGQAWTVTTGTWGISNNKAYSVTDAQGDLVWLESGVADGIFECVVNGTLNSGVNYRLPQLMFRGNGQYEYLLADLFNGNVDLYKDDGVGADLYTLLASAATITNDATDYTVRAVCTGNLVDIYVDGVLKISHTLAGGNTKYAAYTRVGMRHSISGAPATASRFDNFSVQAGIP